MSQKAESKSPLEEGLITALQGIDKQILREVSTRSPSGREEHGVQKWEPIEKRVEYMSSFILNELGEQTVGLDGILVMAQAFAKTLQLVAEDLGEEGLGELRSSYIKAAFEQLERSAFRGTQALSSESTLN
jgi:hypothetical protein